MGIIITNTYIATESFTGFHRNQINAKENKKNPASHLVLIDIICLMVFSGKRSSQTISVTSTPDSSYSSKSLVPQ
jgi:hypothetical protein